jgi:MFS family permease
MIEASKLMFSSDIFGYALFAGLLCTFCSTVINDFFGEFVTEKPGKNNSNKLVKYLVVCFTAGPLLGIIFYAFCHSNLNPIKDIFLFSALIGIVSPILSHILIIFSSKLASRS